MTRTRRLMLTALVVGLIGFVAGAGTYAAFSSTTSNGGNAFDNAFAVGNVYISDNDAGAAMLTLTNAMPGDSAQGCIEITSTASLDSTLTLYGGPAGALTPYLTLVVTRGIDPAPAFSSCAGFTPDPTDYIGAGPGVIYVGPLSSYPAGYASGITDPTAASPESWTTSEKHSYKFVVTLSSDPAAQGLSGSATFVWEARNL